MPLSILPPALVLIAIKPVVNTLVAVKFVVHETSFIIAAIDIGHLAFSLSVSTIVNISFIGAPRAVILKHWLSI